MVVYFYLSVTFERNDFKAEYDNFLQIGNLFQ